MRRILKENRVPIIVFFAVLVVFVLNLSLINNDTNQLTLIRVYTTSQIFVVLLILFYILRVKSIMIKAAGEIKKLPDDLSDKSYEHIVNEMSVFYHEMASAKKTLEQKRKTRQELLDIVNTIASNMDFETLLKELLPKLNEAARSFCSAFYTVNQNTGKLELKHSVGFSKNIYSEFDITLGEGIVGEAVVKGEVAIYQDIPDDTVYMVRTFIGKIKPKSLIIVPVHNQEQVTGVLVSASIYNYTREDTDMIELIRQYLGIAVNNGVNYDKNKRLTSELTFQNKLIQDQHEDMKKRLDEKIQLLNNIVETTVVDSCLYALDIKGVIQIWNKGAERIHGIKAKQAIGRNIETVYDEANWPSVSKSIQRSIKEGGFTESFWFNSPSGYRFRYEMTMTCMYNEDGEPVGIITVIMGA